VRAARRVPRRTRFARPQLFSMFQADLCVPLKWRGRRGLRQEWSSGMEERAEGRPPNAAAGRCRRRRRPQPSQGPSPGAGAAPGAAPGRSRATRVTRETNQKAQINVNTRPPPRLGSHGPCAGAHGSAPPPAPSKLLGRDAAARAVRWGVQGAAGPLERRAGAVEGPPLLRSPCASSLPAPPLPHSPRVIFLLLCPARTIPASYVKATLCF
jgi:hypothetical protein